MKTIADLDRMREIPCPPFDNQYDFLMKRLEDDYIAKIDGFNRVRKALEDWDTDAQIVIIERLIQNIRQLELIDFNYKELRNLILNRSPQRYLYIDESGNNGNVVPNQYGKLFRNHQAQFVLGGLMVKNSDEQDYFRKKYMAFKKHWQLGDEYKSCDILKSESSEILEDFIERILDDTHFQICCYDKKFYLASLISYYMFGAVQSKDPLDYYKYTSALAREKDCIFQIYCECVENPSNEKIETFLKFMESYTYEKFDDRNNNPYKSIARLMLTNRSEHFKKPYLSRGEYEKIGNINVINMNALGELIFSICYMENITVDDIKVYHDKIEQYEAEICTMYDKRVSVEFLDSKTDILIQIADNLAGIFRRLFSETIEIFSSKQQWKKEKYPYLLSRLIDKISVKNIKFVVPIADWALALTVQKMFAPDYPMDQHKDDCFWVEFLRQRQFVETTIMNSDYTYRPD